MPTEDSHGTVSAGSAPANQPKDLEKRAFLLGRMQAASVALVVVGIEHPFATASNKDGLVDPAPDQGAVAKLYREPSISAAFLAVRTA